MIDSLVSFATGLVEGAPAQFWWLLGGLFGVEDAAARLADDLRAALDEAAALRATLPDERVLYLIWREPWMTIARDTYIAATLAEVVAASGVTASEVADFINANLATGYAEFVPPAPPEPEVPAQKPASGLFGRIRGR